jgi:hypothetical protein
MLAVAMPSGFDNQWILCHVTEHLFHRNAKGEDAYLEPGPRPQKR